MANNLTIRPRNGLDKDKVLTSYDVEFLIDGKPMHGITSARLDFVPGEAVCATLELWTQIDYTDGIIAKILMAHPTLGSTKEVKAIEFADGSRMVF